MYSPKVPEWLFCAFSLKSCLVIQKWKFKINSEEKKNKNSLVVLCIHPEPWRVSELSLRICCSFLVGLKSKDHPPCRHLGIYTVVRDFKTHLYVQFHSRTQSNTALWRVILCLKSGEMSTLYKKPMFSFRFHIDPPLNSFGDTSF